MVAVAAFASQVVFGEFEARRGQEFLGALVVEGGPFEVEEEQLGLDLGGAFRSHLEQGSIGRVRRISGETQVGVVEGTAGTVGNVGEAGHGDDQVPAGDLGDLAFIVGGDTSSEATSDSSRAATAAASGSESVSVLEEVVEVPGDFFRARAMRFPFLESVTNDHSRRSASQSARR